MSFANYFLRENRISAWDAILILMRQKDLVEEKIY